MIIGVLKEPEHENRVALIPENVAELLKLNCKEILIPSLISLQFLIFIETNHLWFTSLDELEKG